MGEGHRPAMPSASPAVLRGWLLGTGLVLAITTPCFAQSGGAAQTRQHAQMLFEQGRAALRAGDRFAALRNFAQARSLVPGNADYGRAVADVLVELNAPQGAAQALGADKDIGIRSRQAAAEVRWGSQVPSLDRTHPYADTDAAIAHLQSLITEAGEATPVDDGLLLRLRRDLVVALRDRGRWDDALALACQLRASAGSLPPYVRIAEADALLGARRPDEAQQAYQEVLVALPNSRDARIGLFFAQVESEDFDAAFANVDSLASEGTAWRVVGTGPPARPNEDWLDSQILAAQARRFADMPADAWRRINPLADAAPGSAYLRLERGETAAARGWSRLAHEEILIAKSLAPEDFTIDLALADSQFRRRDWRGSEQRAENLARIDPVNSHLQQLLDDQAAHRSAELIAELAPRTAEGGSDVAPGDGLTAAVRVYTPPIRERWRLLAAGERETSKPEDVRLERNRYGAGIEGRWPDVTFELTGWANTGMLDHAGADASLQWQPDDHWTLGASLQAFSMETPLRAVEAGIRADAAGISTGYAWNESRIASVGLTAMDFTDGNDRLQLNADFGATVVDTPKLDVVLRPSLSLSRNTLRDTPYFNPERDASLMVAAELWHILWREYERSLSQRLIINAGGYWQRDFGQDVIGDITYEHFYRHDPRTEWNYGISWSRRLYDGDAERLLTAFVRLRQRF
ncbi:poly-beta-1,6 N-acetyl-D-glucosamine export porin PgaA [Lysobacter arenosi]|uniref:Poly-beta-1,6 N-acetyl-D-glucosamine export porin PgaA n=1 Tax=Lysobacter arenosi TaxID=2795387 RepID=A0ABX7R8W0_9GAMM|nr:poly-beta-1,6 N-acetyl-D-glucosamine export porin PgaA [Lysobacter arenosi]QSX73847.1 poly-beta-1,6 N-acetyl-D-glucosamine export porin PgaA [Lysobacter arenosi]